MKINVVETKSILTKSKLPDADYVINPYIGCQHACIYCYADFMKRFTGHNDEEWGEFVDIKINSSETLKTQKFKDKLILIGSVTDPYQPVESEYKITQKILEKLLPFQPNLEILTKSTLVYRDINLLKKFKKLRVGISLNNLDKNISKKLEPYAPSPEKRIRTLNKLHSERIKTYLFISPIFPGITDYKEIIEETEPHIDEVLFENLNIRSNNKERILNFVESYNPELLNLYRRKNSEYWCDLENDIASYCKEKQLKFRIYFRHGRKNETTNN